MDARMKITLTHDEQCLAEKVGTARSKFYGKKGYHTLFGRAKELGADWIHVDATGAEIAFCRAYGVEPMLAADEGRHYDAILVGPGGIRFTVDVKHRDTEFGPMNIKRQDGKRLPDLFAFVVGTMPNYRIAGFIDAKEATTEEHMNYDLDRPCYQVKQRELKETPW